MTVFLATIAQRATEIRRLARLVSAEAWWDLRTLAPSITSVSSVVSIGAAIVASKLRPTTGVVQDGSHRRSIQRGRGLLGVTWWSGVRASRHAATWRTIGMAVVFLIVTLAASQGLERAINRILRPDAEEWTWIGDVILSAGLVLVTIFWLRLKQARATISSLDAQRIVLDAELSIAANVQRALLPSIPEPLNGIQWYASGVWSTRPV